MAFKFLDYYKYYTWTFSSFNSHEHAGSVTVFNFPYLITYYLHFSVLGLNVSTTRAILSNGDAGGVVETFGTFVTGGNIVVGLVVFVILVIIQFIVITKGAERVSEVAARFTLDAMPGKQMSIDADLNAGMISETEARTTT